MTRSIVLLLPLSLIAALPVVACGAGEDGALPVQPDPDLPLPRRGGLPGDDASAEGSVDPDGTLRPVRSDAGAGDAQTGAKAAPLPPAPACALDTRTVYFEAGRKIESITAYGTYWSRELFADGSFKEALGFPGPVASEPKFASGPCNGSPTCTLDARTVYFDGATKIESTVAQGRLYAWTFDPSNGSAVWLPGYPQTLATTPALRDGPCSANPNGCKLDTRAIWREQGQKLESITAYGKVWTFSVDAAGNRSLAPGSGMSLASVPRWAAGPCLGHESTCTFDTRTVYVDGEGIRREEVTARGRLWAWMLGPGDGVLATLSNGAALVDIPRLESVCP